MCVSVTCTHMRVYTFRYAKQTSSILALKSPRTQLPSPRVRARSPGGSMRRNGVCPKGRRWSCIAPHPRWGSWRWWDPRTHHSSVRKCCWRGRGMHGGKLLVPRLIPMRVRHHAWAHRKRWMGWESRCRNGVPVKRLHRRKTFLLVSTATVPILLFLLLLLLLLLLFFQGRGFRSTTLRHHSISIASRRRRR